MMRSLITLTILLLSSSFIFAQNPRIISGPIQGATTPTSTSLWLMGSHIESVTINGEAATLTKVNDSMSVAQHHVEGLSAGVQQIPIRLKGKAGTPPVLHSKEVDIPADTIGDFSFLLGSCTFPHKPKNKRWHIFDKMAEIPTDFMMWMGDNIYLILGDWKSREKINHRYVRYRTNEHLNRFLSTRPHFAAWDDHDFGPNNSDATFELKDTTLQAFKDFWANPAYGTDSLPGTFYHFEWQDADFFVLDGRYYQQGGQMYGKEQMKWLQQGLKDSDASVKFVVGGSQFLVQPKSGEDWGDFPEEKEDFLHFVKEEGIEGLVFLSGDRHLAELTVLEDWGGPKIVEMTSSPMTSFVNHTFFNRNPHRVKGTLTKKRNFGKITLSGKAENRKMRMQLFDKKARLVWQHEFWVKDLK